MGSEGLENVRIVTGASFGDVVRADPPGCNDVEAVPTLEDQLRVFDALAGKALEQERRDWADARERFIEGYHLYKNSWLKRDLVEEERQERLDALNYRVMAAMKRLWPGVGEE